MILARARYLYLRFLFISEKIGKKRQKRLVRNLVLVKMKIYVFVIIEKRQKRLVRNLVLVKMKIYVFVIITVKVLYKCHSLISVFEGKKECNCFLKECNFF